MAELYAALREPEGTSAMWWSSATCCRSRPRVAWALGAGVEVAWRLHLDQASITRIAVGADGPVVHTYNDIAHLAGGPPAA